jgi:hypothetical protein
MEVSFIIKKARFDDDLVLESGKKELNGIGKVGRTLPSDLIFLIILPSDCLSYRE